jgi:hypothetical protein
MLALLVGAGPAAAQFGDPLGLIASGGLQPFVSSGSSITVAEFASPVNCLSGPSATCPFPSFHLVFFNDLCTRGLSKALPLTTNDVEVVVTSVLGSGFTNGLIAFGVTGATGAELLPLTWPVFARAHEINFLDDYIRSIDPISIIHGEAGLLWNRMRTGAAFWAPQDGSLFRTSLYLVCPNANIQARDVGPGGVFTQVSFPDLDPDSAAVFGTDLSASIQGVVFDEEEEFLNDLFITCNCLTIRTLASIGGPYLLPGGTYTELLGGSFPFANCPGGTPGEQGAGCARTFAAYRAIHITDAGLAGGQLDDFGATWNAAALNLGGVTPPLAITPIR